jgi:hypothetical protein
MTFVVTKRPTVTQADAANIVPNRIALTIIQNLVNIFLLMQQFFQQPIVL